MKYAPVVLFVYNRVDHVKHVIRHLAQNKLAKESDLYIFSDGPKENSINAVQEVRKYIKSIQVAECFQNVVIKESEQNLGLANSIIGGVSEIIKKYKRVIVIEDDVLTTTDFLTFMNDSLDFYENSNNIWSIGGMNILGNTNNGKDVFLAQRTCSCAWASWENRWNKVDWNVRTYDKFKNNIVRRYQFNRFGMDRAVMLDEQQAGINNSWAIRFCFAEFENGMFTVYPNETKAKNIGYDGSGTHCGKGNSNFIVELPEEPSQYTLIPLKKVDSQIYGLYKEKYKSSLIYACARLLKARLGIKGSIRKKEIMG